MRDDLQLPLFVLRDRRIHGLSLGEALALYLCEDKRGPKMSRSEAAELMGLEDKRNILTLVKRGQKKLGGPADE